MIHCKGSYYNESGVAFGGDNVISFIYNNH